MAQRYTGIGKACSGDAGLSLSCSLCHYLFVGLGAIRDSNSGCHYLYRTDRLREADVGDNRIGSRLDGTVMIQLLDANVATHWRGRTILYKSCRESIYVWAPEVNLPGHAQAMSTRSHRRSDLG